MENIISKIVGYTPKHCECHDDGRPSDYRDSLSGLYVDEGEHGIPLIVPVKSCGDGTLWDLLTRARSQAAVDFITYHAKEARTFKNEVIDSKTTDVGEKSYTYFNPLKTYNGFLAKPKIFKGLKWIMQSLTLRLNKDANVDLVIKRGDAVVLTDTISVTGNTDAELLTSEQRINLFTLGRAENIAVYYSVDNDAKAVNNSLHCGCNNNTANWAKIFTIDGKRVTTEADTLTDTYKTKEASGLRLYGRLECVGLEWLEDVSPEYWTQSAYGRLMAKAVQLVWAVKIIEEVLNAGRINSFTLLSREHLYGKRNKFQKMAAEIIPLLAAQMPEFLSHCYQCNDHYGFNKQTL